jgi:hypothetical protein
MMKIDRLNCVRYYLSGRKKPQDSLLFNNKPDEFCQQNLFGAFDVRATGRPYYVLIHKIQQIDVRRLFGSGLRTDQYELNIFLEKLCYSGGKLVWIILVVQGVGMLLSSQTFTFAESYYHNRLCFSKFESLFENAFNTTFGFTSLVGLCLSIAHQHRWSLRSRILITLWVTVAILVFNTVLVLIPPSELPPEILFWISVCSLGLIGLFNSIQQGAFFAIAGQLPSRYRGAIMVGFGLSSLLISSVSIITTATQPPTQDICHQSYETLKWPVFAYFSFTVSILVLCLILFGVFMRLAFVLFYITPNADDVTPRSKTSRNNAEALLPVATHDDTPSSVSSTFVLLTPFLYSITISFFITFLGFPSLTSHVKTLSKNKTRFFTDFFTPFHFLVFSIGDTTGRGLCNFVPVIPNTPRGRKMLILLSTTRILFIPAFLFCNVATTNDSSYPLPVVFGDAGFFAFLFFFSFSSGYLGTAGMMLAPGHVHEPDMAMAGVMSVFALTLGQSLGGVASFGFLPLTNPQ